ncbi:ribonuclease HII [Sutcliffiella rhizosphaerae]|uniref:Ribonuclease HII n=1 Tax=Sutcliffiella rhizosphaerae TaxID=2880967 RepID=A0ABM8YIJ3_9BACI|nr:ribonuclease HII [Sutcliffiella rhizosphaerae]CAG9619728.1 Ribonuclease HII [Sutcliffiella rhizosphaerae]
MKKKSIKEIEKLLNDLTDLNTKEYRLIKEDERKGVQTLIKKWQRKKVLEEQLLKQHQEMQKYERDSRDQGYEYIAGVDEVGRGPLAGPVVAAAVILPKDFYLPGLTDSKKLSPQKRKEFYHFIVKHALSYGIGIIDPKQIDQINIYEATKLAMIQAIEKMSVAPDHLLIDAMKLDISISQTSIIKGDAKSITIAAASVLAKETRDTLMKNLGQKHPEYGFEKNMGYGTKEHLIALQEVGVTEEHRQSFSPVKDMISH